MKILVTQPRRKGEAGQSLWVSTRKKTPINN